jgi:putative transposase
MKKSKFTDSQIIAILNLAEAGTPVPDLCREHGISSATFYKWRAKFGGMDASLMVIPPFVTALKSRFRPQGPTSVWG